MLLVIMHGSDTVRYVLNHSLTLMMVERIDMSLERLETGKPFRRWAQASRKEKMSS